jgi:hypothetical protein
VTLRIITEVYRRFGFARCLRFAIIVLVAAIDDCGGPAPFRYSHAIANDNSRNRGALPSRCCRPAVATIERYAAHGLRHQGSSGPPSRADRGRRRRGGKYTEAPYEAWIATDPFKGGFRVLITGPHRFERTVMFARDDDPAVIAERVRETLDE